MAVGQGQWDRLSKEWPPRKARQGPRTQKRMSLLSDLQFPRHLTEGAGQAKGEGSPVMSDGALEGGEERNRERSRALLWSARWRSSVSIPAVLDWRAPGCGSAPACRCAESAVLRAGRARSSTPQSRQRCDKRGTAERKCRTDLDRAERSGPRPAVLAPREGTRGGTEGTRAPLRRKRRPKAIGLRLGVGWVSGWRGGGVAIEGRGLDDGIPGKGKIAEGVWGELPSLPIFPGHSQTGMSLQQSVRPVCQSLSCV